ncbi:hypothetical protein BM477_00740 [Boudabousia marimammalium]|uniref:Uncharacterized protein n=1 Tax=Boudabousia marimammalium TaxID=156892 RepID=A0A1Q5PSH5_9ACTO|nr:hypothetical protein BM477_00740 [Boudabousia marimammalium]
MIAVRMMQMPIMQIISMIPMLHGWVSAVLTVIMVDVSFSDYFLGNLMLVVMITVGMVQMPIMEEICVILTLNRGVPTILAVIMVGMGFSNFVIAHRFAPLSLRTVNVTVFTAYKISCIQPRPRQGGL